MSFFKKSLFAFNIILVGFLAFSNPILNLPAHAQTDNFQVYAVKATTGLRVRDKDCNVVNVLGYGSPVAVTSLANTTIPCFVGGKQYAMVKIGLFTEGAGFNIDNVYVAQDYIVPLKEKTFYPGSSTFTVDSEGGLNLRDPSNCHKITAVPNGTTLSQPESPGNFYKVCKGGDGGFYQMIDITYKGKTYYVATSYLK